jgi:hypothetical protein
LIVIGEHVCHWVAQRTGGEYFGGGQGIGWTRDGELVGGVLVDNSTGRSVQMHCAGIGGHWLSKSLLRYSFHYVFNELQVHKAIALVDSTNVEALRLDRHLGFVQEAVITGTGRHGDTIILSMTRDQCRYLET